MSKLIKTEHEFKFDDVDYLEVEIFETPCVGLSVNFLWRFSKPFAGILNEEPIKLPYIIDKINPSCESRLKEIFLLKWKEMIKDNCGDSGDLRPNALIEK